MLPEAAAQLVELGYIPPPPDVPERERRAQIRQQVVRRIRGRRRQARLIAARWHW